MRMIPKLPQNIQVRDSETMAIRGLNLTDNFADGDLESVLNISTDSYPYFEPVRNADRINTAETPDEVFYWDGKMFYLSTYLDPQFPETNEVYVYEAGNDSSPVCQYLFNMSEVKPRKFAAVAGKLLILPDYAVIEKTGNGYEAYIVEFGNYILLSNAVYGEHTITLSAANRYRLTDAGTVHLGQQISITGSSVNRGYTGVITDINRSEGTITVDKELTVGTEGNSGAHLNYEGIPNLDYICSWNNRIWGCATTVENGYKKQLIYASALGNPYVYDDYSSLLGGWTTEVECDDEWTGCAGLPSCVCFFKERKILRVLGTSPSEFAVYTSNCEGVKKDCWKTLLNINDALYYLGAHGVYIYSGSLPVKISDRLGNRMFGMASAGTDGLHYYIQMAEVDINYNRLTDYTLYVYNLEQGFWTAYDTQTTRMSFAQGNTLGVTYLRDGALYMTNPANDSDGIPFEMTFKPMYGTMTGSYNRMTEIFGKKRYLKTSIRMECGDEGTYTIYCQFDDGEWEEIGKRLPDTPTEKKSGVDIYAIPNNHCDRFRMKITGEGNVRLLGIQREYVLSGRR